MDDSRLRERARWLLLVAIVLVAYGSLYPFRFAVPADPYAQLWRLISDWRLWSGLADVAGNVLLFMPLGLGGTFALRQRVPAARVLFIASVIAFAFALQAAQVFAPGRNAAMSDVVHNAIGLLLGMAAGTALRRLSPARAAGGSAIDWVPISLVLIWLCLELWPFVPTLDLQQIKSSLKPLLKAPRWSAWSAADVGLGLAVVAHMLRSTARPLLLLSGVVAASSLGSMVIVGHQLSAGRFVGLVVGLAAGAAILRAKPRAAALALLVAALLWYIAGELRPFEIEEAPHRFHWLPFEAMLVGSMQANLIALVWNLFWLGAVLTLVKEQGGRVTGSAVVLSALVLCLELAQTWLPNRTADVTPALLPWLWAIALRPTSGRTRAENPLSLPGHAAPGQSRRPRSQGRS